VSEKMREDGRRVAVVTGAVRGIGAAVARRLVVEGFAVACIDIDERIVERAAEYGATGFVADVADVAEVERAFSEIRIEVGPVDVLVNNAALTAVHRSWETVTPEDWDRVMGVNARSMFLCGRAAVTDMRRRSWGRIVNLSSATVGLGARNLLDYVSSKGAVVGFTRSFAREVGADFITVNAIAPGSIQTEVDIENFPDQGAIESEQVKVQAIPRRGLPDDISGVVAFLVSEDASFISGQTLYVDGGWVMA